MIRIHSIRWLLKRCQDWEKWAKNGVLASQGATWDTEYIKNDRLEDPRAIWTLFSSVKKLGFELVWVWKKSFQIALFFVRVCTKDQMSHLQLRGVFVNYLTNNTSLYRKQKKSTKTELEKISVDKKKWIIK